MDNQQQQVDFNQFQQQQQANSNLPITLSLTLAQYQVLLNSLGNAPLNQVGGLYALIQTQGGEQIRAHQARQGNQNQQTPNSEGNHSTRGFNNPLLSTQ